MGNEETEMNYRIVYTANNSVVAYFKGIKAAREAASNIYSKDYHAEKKVEKEEFVWWNDHYNADMDKKWIAWLEAMPYWESQAKFVSINSATNMVQITNSPPINERNFFYKKSMGTTTEWVKL